MAQSANKASRTSWIAGASALLSLIACYGTLAVITLLSMMGVTLVVNERVWAGVIVAFAVIAVIGITLGYSRHRNHNPARLGIVGAALVIWAMYGSYGIRELLGVSPQFVESAGFAALLGAAYWDWKLKR
jgi:fatty-acid desaturase